jgi:hypothetical protein
MSIQVSQVKGDVVELIFNPREEDLRVRETLRIQELDSGGRNQRFGHHHFLTIGNAVSPLLWNRMRLAQDAHTPQCARGGGLPHDGSGIR